VYESNTLLRLDKDAAVKQVSEVQQLLQTTEKSMETMRSGHVELEAAKLSLESERNDLQAEVEKYRGMYESVIHRFGEIDPETHAQVLEELSSLKSENLELEKQLQEIKSQLEEKEKEVEFKGEENVRLAEKINRQVAKIKELKSSLVSSTNADDSTSLITLVEKSKKLLSEQSSKIKALKEKIISLETTIEEQNGRFEGDQRQYDSFLLIFY
jgi:chromosome segregation ATPase